MEQTLHDRIRDLDERESEVEQKLASLEADWELRATKLDQRASSLEQLERRLEQKESQVAAYVGQVQSKLDKADGEWWQKQLNGQGTDAAGMRKRVERCGMETAIRAEALSKQFRKGPRAVDAIDLDVAPGEIYGFLGPNGAGKSTTVHMLTTLPAAELRHGDGRRLRRGAAGPAGAADDRGRAPGGRARPVPHRTRPPAPPGLAPRDGARGADSARRRAARAGRPHPRRRAPRPHVLRRDEAAARPRARARPPAHRSCSSTSPTTGLDPQSRSALWTEVARLAREDGVTVFLTTQYLEEADVLADRVGIIHRGRIVAEGTPAALKAQIGRPTVEAAPADPEQLEEAADTLRRFGDPTAAQPGTAAVLLADGYDLADVVRALDAAEIERGAAPPPRAARSTTSSWRRPAGRSRARAREKIRRPSRWRDRRSPSLAPRRPCFRVPFLSKTWEPPVRLPLGATRLPYGLWLSRRASLADPYAPPAGKPVLRVRLPAHVPGGDLERPLPADRLPGFPGATYFDFALAIPFVHGALFAASTASTELARDIETGFLNRLALTTGERGAARARPPRRGDPRRRRPGLPLPRRRSRGRRRLPRRPGRRRSS